MLACFHMFFMFPTIFTSNAKYCSTFTQDTVNNILDHAPHEININLYIIH